MVEPSLTQSKARFASAANRSNECRSRLCRGPELSGRQPGTGDCRIEVSPGRHGADLQLGDGSVPSSFKNLFAPMISMSRKLQRMDSASAKSARSPWFRFLARSISIGIALTLVSCFVITSKSGAAAHKSYRVTYSYSCCSWKRVHTDYRPGNRLIVRWSPLPDSSPPNVRLQLNAWIVGPFPTSNFLNDNTESPTPGSGLRKVSAVAVRLSNSVPSNPVSVIRLPLNTAPGYYDLWTEIVWLNGSGSGSGATIIHVSK